MKVYISVDMEGICGTTSWNDVTRGKVEYPEFQRQLTREVTAACEGAFAAGATEILINDAHDSARNLLTSELPLNTQVIRGWSYHPYMMMQELDSSFAAALLIGYHSFAGSGGNPLSHTMATRIASLVLNDQPVSEFLISTYTAALVEVPLVFVSGDRELCEHAAEVVPKIETVAVKSGIGSSTINLHPKTVCDNIQTSVENALSGNLTRYQFPLPEWFDLTITYKMSHDAYRSAFYPGAKLVSPCVVKFKTDNYFELLRLFLFVL